MRLLKWIKDYREGIEIGNGFRKAQLERSLFRIHKPGTSIEVVIERSWKGEMEENLIYRDDVKIVEADHEMTEAEIQDILKLVVEYHLSKGVEARVQ